MKKYPYCSAIVLNYFGGEVIQDTLNALLNQNYPKDKLEIIVVDNNSKDESGEIISKYSRQHSNIKLIKLDENLGFSRGNNIGIKQAKGEYVALVNNDCVVERDWLKELVTTAAKNKNIFAVNSKILLYPKYIKIQIKLNPKLVSVYAWLSETKLLKDKNKIIYLPLWRKLSNNGNHWTICSVEAFFDPIYDKFFEFTLLLNSKGNKFSRKPIFSDLLQFEDKYAKLVNVEIKGDDIECRIRMHVSSQASRQKTEDKIQNAGIMIFQDGYARDIGALVRDNQQYYEFDLKQYDKEREVYAACAAAVLYRKEILVKIGLLSEEFFMYYEDVDVSERARLAGFKTFYSPKAVARHRHAFSSKESSAFFTYHVERGRLMHVFLNFPLRIFFKQYFYLLSLNLAFLIKILLNFHRFFYVFKSRKKPEGESKFLRRIQTIKALGFFPINLPRLFIKRLRLDVKRDRGAVQVQHKQILEGRWYFD